MTELDHCADQMEIENDWLCPECAKHWPSLELADLVVACIHCIRELRHGGEGEVAGTDFEIEAAIAKEAEANDRFRQLLFDFLETPDS